MWLQHSFENCTRSRSHTRRLNHRVTILCTSTLTEIMIAVSQKSRWKQNQTKASETHSQKCTDLPRSPPTFPLLPFPLAPTCLVFGSSLRDESGTWYEALIKPADRTQVFMTVNQSQNPHLSDSRQQNLKKNNNRKQQPYFALTDGVNSQTDAVMTYGS